MPTDATITVFFLSGSHLFGFNRSNPIFWYLLKWMCILPASTAEDSELLCWNNVCWSADSRELAFIFFVLCFFVLYTDVIRITLLIADSDWLGEEIKHIGDRLWFCNQQKRLWEYGGDEMEELETARQMYTDSSGVTVTPTWQQGKRLASWKLCFLHKSDVYFVVCA